MSNISTRVRRLLFVHEDSLAFLPCPIYIGRMFGDEKKLKDSSSTPSASYRADAPGVSIIISHAKTQKLVTALYMVTDIIDRDEPLRNKLRTLGVEILSDIHIIQQNNTGNTMSFICNKISEVMSFLGIASDINIISEMNCNILRKEFAELNQSIKDSINNNETHNKQIDLSEFFTTPSIENSRTEDRFLPQNFSQENSKGHPRSNSIGVQKGSTLLNALKQVSVSNKNVPAPYQARGFGVGFDALKKQRQDSIINIIKTISGGLPAQTGATIKDIKDKVQVNPSQAGTLASTSEKTLQRELVSMVKNGVLERTGEKRWSKYFLK